MVDPGTEETIEDLISRADLAMYEQKRQPKRSNGATLANGTHGAESHAS
jgi:hypothetical protein